MTLLEAIKKQEEQLIALKAILESELHLISSREPETLMALLQEKEEALSAIDAQEGVIAPLYEAAKSTNEISGEINEGVARCNAIVEECKYMTEISAKSVEQGQLRLSHLRNLMMELRAKETMTYDKSGKTRGDSTGGGFSA
jgi:flagella synthesis protein FlgN